MPETHQQLSCNNVHEAVRSLKIQSTDNKDGDGVFSYPNRPGEPDCGFYMRTGTCGYGANCRFNHPAKFAAEIGQFGGRLPQRAGEPECKYFLKTGACKYGSSCKYHHPPDRHGAGSIVLNSYGLPMRQEEKSCPYYMRAGVCKFGIVCKFNHPELSSAGTALPVIGTVVGGSAGFIVIPSSGLSYAGGIPSWPLINETYLSSALSQGLGWSSYMVSLNGQITPALTTVNTLPERHDQPECRHFMNTGSCKYGSDCKYNHPREKISQVAASSLSPFGLPLRPGQAICSYYTTYGICKYGPTCKYDHPLLGYPYSYGTNFATVSTSYPSSFPYEENSPIFHSCETSPSKSPQVPDCAGKVDATSQKDTSGKATEESHTNVKAAEESPEPAKSLSPSVSPHESL
ncbi:hypothetical protein AgCh_003045 [Apium graveolens]